MTPNELESLIVDLAHDKYIVRKQAATALLQADVEALPILKANYDNPDPEVRMTVRRLLQEYQNIKPANGIVPIIWALPTAIRYRLNVWNEQTQSFDTDLARQFYEEQYIAEREEGGPKKWPVTWGAHIGRVILYEHSLMGSRRNYTDAQDNTITARIATENLIKQFRMDGLSRASTLDLLEIMQKNENECYFVEYVEQPSLPQSWIKPQNPVSVMLTKPVKEGVWQNQFHPEKHLEIDFPL